MLKANSKLFESIIKFGIVGLLAVVTQACSFVALTYYCGLSGFAASFWALIVSLMISYYGQSRWTFSDRKKRSIFKFSIIAMMSFVLNTGAGLLIVDWWQLSPIWVVPIILSVPFFSFLTMRGWAFTKL